MEDQNFLVLAKDRQFLPFFNEYEKQWAEPFFFIQAADTQYGMQEKYMEKKDPYGWEQEIVWSRQLVHDVNAMFPRPKFLVVCGDLLDAWPHTEAEIRRRQEVDFKKVFAGLEIPLVCVCGNHDVGNTPTPATVAGYRSSFGDDFFSFWCGGVFFIVLNTQYYEDASKCADLATQQEAWLEEQLQVVRREKPQHTVVFQHIPFFLSHPEEEKVYFNMEIGLRRAMLDKLYDAGVRYIFCGHYHRNGGGFYKDMEEVVTSAVGAQLGDSHHGYRLVRVLEDRLIHQYYALGTAPTFVYLPSNKATPAATATPPMPAWSVTAAASASPGTTRNSSLVL